MNDRAKFAKIQKILENHEKRIKNLEKKLSGKQIAKKTSGKKKFKQ